MDKAETIKSILGDIFAYLGVDPDFRVDETEDNIFQVLIQGDDLSFLIGHHGAGLDSMQVLVNQMCFGKWETPSAVIIDINDYRVKKTGKLQEIAKKCIDKVRFFEEEIALPPMSPWERKQVHTFISEYGDVTSESQGAGSERRVVIKPKK